MDVELVGGEDEVANFTGDHGLGFTYKGFQVVKVGVGSHNDEVELVGVEAAGEVANQVNFFRLAKLVDDAFDDIVNADIFSDDTLNVGE